MLGQMRCQMIILINWIHFPTANCQHSPDCQGEDGRWDQTDVTHHFIISSVSLKSNCNGKTVRCEWLLLMRGICLGANKIFYIFHQIKEDLCQLIGAGNVIVPKKSSDEQDGEWSLAAVIMLWSLLLMMMKTKNCCHPLSNEENICWSQGIFDIILANKNERESL